MKPATPLPWHTRGPARGLRLFIEAPKAEGMPYALDVCGDDYTGYGEEEAREQNMRYIVHAANSLPDLLADRDRLKAVNAELVAALQWIVTDDVYKSPESYSEPDVTTRWVECARAALIKART